MADGILVDWADDMVDVCSLQHEGRIFEGKDSPVAGRGARCNTALTLGRSMVTKEPFLLGAGREGIANLSRSFLDAHPFNLHTMYLYCEYDGDMIIFTISENLSHHSLKAVPRYTHIDPSKNEPKVAHIIAKLSIPTKRTNVPSTNLQLWNTQKIRLLAIH